jgi:sigma-B regulation protein RsbU (phosphoserine phosphatase)
METITNTVLHTELLDRRQRLEAAIGELGDNAHLVRLLQEVDAALERMDQGTYGLCDVCHEPVEAGRLLADPLVRNCLDHLTPDEQRALEQDLSLASQIQSTLLPQQHLSLNGWEICYHYEAAGSVSGDYCDLVNSESEGKDLFFFFGDVSGKGVAASMLMAHLHAIFRSLTTIGLPLDQLVERANRVFCESTMSTHYATLVCGKVGQSGEMEICNAGHCPPLLVRGGEIIRLEATGLPVGLFGDGPYSVKKEQLARGDSLILYTDGLSEARNGLYDEYGVERLSHLVRDHHELPPQALIQTCLKDLRAFQSGASKTDDLTIMVIRRVK